MVSHPHGFGSPWQRAGDGLVVALLPLCWVGRPARYCLALAWHILPMGRFTRDPQEWLRLVAKARARFTKGPSSAWAVAVRGFAKRPEGVDLSCLHGAVFLGEVVDPDVR